MDGSLRCTAKMSEKISRKESYEEKNWGGTFFFPGLILSETIILQENIA